MKVIIENKPHISKNSIIQIEVTNDNTYLIEQNNDKIIKYRIQQDNQEDNNSGLIFIENKYLDIFNQPVITTTTRNIVLQERKNPDIQIKVNYLKDIIPVQINQPKEILFKIDKNDLMNAITLLNPNRPGTTSVVKTTYNKVLLTSFTSIDLYQVELELERDGNEFEAVLKDFNTLRAILNVNATDGEIEIYRYDDNNNLLIQGINLQAVIRVLDIPIPQYQDLIRKVKESITEKVYLRLNEEILDVLKICKSISSEIEIRVYRDSISIYAQNETAKFGQYFIKPEKSEVIVRKKIILNSERLYDIVETLRKETDMIEVGIFEPIFIKGKNTSCLLATIGKIEKGGENEQ